MVHTEAFDGVGPALRTCHAEACETIPAHWVRFHGGQVRARIPKRVSDDVHPVYTAFEHEGRIDIWVGLR